MKNVKPGGSNDEKKTQREEIKSGISSGIFKGVKYDK